MIRVAIVEDHAAIAEGLAALLASEGMEVVGVAYTAEAADRLIRASRPDVVLCDIMLGGHDEGLELVARLRDESRFLMLSAFDYPAHCARAMRVGASGYLPKIVDAEDLVDAIEAVAAGELRFADTIVERARGARRPPTSRERQMLLVLAEGGSNDEIAAALGISVKTVEGMLRRLFERYGVTNRTGLVRVATTEGWLTAAPR